MKGNFKCQENRSMKNKPSCIILVGDNLKLNKKAVAFAGKHLLVKEVVNFREQKIAEAECVALKPGFVLNFLSDKILKGPLLKLQNINFHPALPELPGRGSASLALFRGDSYYGATAHIMDSSVDSGKILLVKKFRILPNQSCEELFEKGKEACLELFKTAVKYISRHNSLPLPCGEKWKRRPLTRKEFQKWLILNPRRKAEFIKKIKAARHSRFPGPYVIIHGYKFGLVADKQEIIRKNERPKSGHEKNK